MGDKTIYIHIQVGTSNPKVYFNCNEEKALAVVREWRKNYTLNIIKKTANGLYLEAIPKQ